MDTPQNTKNVLLIEDEQAIALLYKRQLDLAGLLTDIFTNGKEGLAALQTKHYDAILLDIMLPDMNGLQILKEIKQNENTKNLLVIMLTNFGQENFVKEGFTLGAQGYLIKVRYTPDEVVKEVINYIAQHEKTTQNQTPMQ